MLALWEGSREDAVKSLAVQSPGQEGEECEDDEDILKQTMVKEVA